MLLPPFFFMRFSNFSCLSYFLLWGRCFFLSLRKIFLSLYFWWANSATYSFLTVKSEFGSSTLPLLTSLCMVFVETPILSDISLCVFFSFKLASIIHLSTSVKCLPFFFLCYNKFASVTFRYFLFLPIQL